MPILSYVASFVTCNDSGAPRVPKTFQKETEIPLNPLAGVETKLFSDFLGLLVLLGCPGFLGWLVLLGCPGFFGLLAFPEASRQFFEGFYFHFYSNNQHLSNVDWNVEFFSLNFFLYVLLSFIFLFSRFACICVTRHCLHAICYIFMKCC